MALLAPMRWLVRAAGASAGRRHPFVLCYHGVGSADAHDDGSGLFVGRELFEAHLDEIEDQGYQVLGAGELWRGLRDGGDGSAIGAITFDDALAKTAREAIPMLLDRGMACSMFVPTGLMGRPHPDVPSERILGAEELLELAAAGVEIGAHSVDHVWLPGLDYADALEQLRRSRATLEDLLGVPVRTMAYPYGGHDEHTERAAAEAGYDVACGCSGPGAWRALSVPREPIHASTSKLRLRLKMAGLYGPAHVLVGDSGPIGRWRSRHEHGRSAGAKVQLSPGHEAV